MSLTNFPGGNSSTSGPQLPKVTMPALADMKRQGKPISALTAYDYATSRLVDEAGIDMILVGDSLAMVVLGHDNTLAVAEGLERTAGIITSMSSLLSPATRSRNTAGTSFTRNGTLLLSTRSSFRPRRLTNSATASVWRLPSSLSGRSSSVWLPCSPMSRA